ncbi:S-formylglutathione hydrolase FrmB [Amycolatopsis thermoflava]|uniref:S-formylglutathione hydrolase FrmB n=1 Tax=Amycolatopsis thermoflava TaxID=84480 RepID=A0A3N2H6A0_9PSEU|nr:S-formylglutathione hydrolase FrmB [Amycolatopsis thermoflava]
MIPCAAAVRPLDWRLVTVLAETPLTGWWPVRVLLLVALVGAGLLAWWLRRRWARVTLAAVAFLLAVVNVLAAVNASYGYYLTVGQVIGLPGRDAASLRQLGQSGVPGSGRLVTITIPGPASHFDTRPAQVYLPPAWFARPRPQLPVVVLLHGTPGAPGDWTGGGDATTTLDSWAAGHGGRAPIVVMPDINGEFDADSECVDGPAGRAETYLARDVPAFVTSRFFTQPPGAQWAVAGLSEGGSCAITLALRHPETFAAFADFSGLAGPRSGDGNDLGDTVPALFAGSTVDFEAHEPAWLLAHRRYPGLGGWFEVGDADDDPLAAARTLEPAAARAGITTRLVVVPGGGHDFVLWRQAFADALPWLVSRVSG